MAPGSYTRLTLAAQGPAGRSAWSPYACATTPAEPWCPTSDTTHPTCSATGAFQAQRGYDHSGHWVIGINDYKTAQPQSNPSFYAGTGPPGPDDLRANEAGAAEAWFWGHGWEHAKDFLSHYLQNTVRDLNFDARIPYSQSRGPGAFAATVDARVKYWVGLVNRSADTFDSGYLGFDPPKTNQWQSDDWENTIGHCFYRVVGTRRADGSWSVHLQVTSYYQFTPGTLIRGPLVIGSDMPGLEQIGWARNFREIGNGTLV